MASRIDDFLRAYYEAGKASRDNIIDLLPVTAPLRLAQLATEASTTGTNVATELKNRAKRVSKRTKRAISELNKAIKGTVVVDYLPGTPNTITIRNDMDSPTPIFKSGDRPTPVTLTKKQKQQRKIQKDAFAKANKKGRKLNGDFRKGWDQQRLAQYAQKECTKERERMGLCERKKRSKR